MVIITVLTLCVGCTTYKKRSEGITNLAYVDEKIKSGVYKLQFYGSEFDSHEKLEKLWHKRAAELCGSTDYKSFSRKAVDKKSYIAVSAGIPYVDTSRNPYINGHVTCKN